MRTHLTPTIDQEFAYTVRVYTPALNYVGELTNMAGRDWVRGVDIQQGIDQAVATCEIKVSREEYELSLAPLDGNSALNATTVVLEIGHIVIVSITDSSGAHEVFRGKIDSVEWAGSPIVVTCRDMAGDLFDAYSETARMYAVGRIAHGVELWTASGAGVDGQWIAPEKLDDTGTAATAVYEVLTSGTFNDLPGETLKWNGSAWVAGDGTWPTHFDEFINGSEATGAHLRRVVVGAADWTPETAYVFGDVIMPTDHGVERMICIREGWSGSALSEPDWPLPGCVVNELPSWAPDLTGCWWSVLPSVTDGGIALEACMGGILADNVPSAPPLYFVTPSGYWRNPFIMQESSVLETLRNLALEIGWDLRLKYIAASTDHATWGHWRLTLYEPARTSTTADATVTAADVYGVSQCATSIANIRNVVQVVYTQMAIGSIDYARTVVKVEDAPSIVKYGRRFFGIGEGSASGISTAIEGAALANAVLSDLKEPGIDFVVDGPLRWYYEINDLLAFSATGFPHFNAEQKLALVGISHAIASNGTSVTAHTTLATRGKPTSGLAVWHERGQGIGKGKPGKGFRPQGSGEVTVIASVKGATAAFKRPKGPKPRGGYGQDAAGEATEAELHVGDTTGFTPSSATLRATTFTDRFELSGMDTGVTKFGVVLLRDKLGNLSAPSPEFTITPQEAKLTDLDSSLRVACAIGQTVRSPALYPLPAVCDVLVPLESVIYNDGSAYGATGFVAPADGVYRFYAHARIYNYSAVPDPVTYDSYMRMVNTHEFSLYLLKNGATTLGGAPSAMIAPRTSGWVTLQTSIVLDADDYVTLWLTSGETTDTHKYHSGTALLTVERVWSR